MGDPGNVGIEGWDPDRGDADLHHVVWDSTDEDVRVWVGQYGGVDDCAVSVSGPGAITVLLRCTRDQLTEWHEAVGRMLSDAADAVAEVDDDAARELS